MTQYTYSRRFFDPKDSTPLADGIGLRGGDHPVKPTERPYVYTEDIILAVNIAMASGRPLLVAGPPGSGKSALAASIARQLRVEYRQQVITARTQARDLLWSYDAVARLRDAQAACVRDAQAPDDDRSLDPANYVTEGVLWQAFEASAAGQRMVVLIDEIDKADPDLPNSLLETIGNGSFSIDDVPGRAVTASPKTPPYIVITTNNERELSRPFVRRCVTLTLPPPSVEQLLEIAASWGLRENDERGVAPALANEIHTLATSARDIDVQPNAAEFLDALRTCLKLKIGPYDPEWRAIRGATLMKHIGPQRDSAAPRRGR